MKLVVFTQEINLGLNEHEVMYVTEVDAHHADIEQRIESFNPDLIIEREVDFRSTSELYQSIYKKLDHPKACWCIDAHITLAQHINHAKYFDYVFCAQSWFLPLFENQVKGKIFYLPLCHTQSLLDYKSWLKEPKPERTIPLSFIGNIRPTLHVDRKEFIEGFLETMGNDFHAGVADYQKTLTLLSQSKMTFNCSLNNDLNFRVWEALATDTPLMTDLVTDILTISNLAQHIAVIYPKKSETQINQAIEQTIRPSSSEFILNYHTLTHRYQSMLKMIKTGLQEQF